MDAGELLEAFDAWRRQPPAREVGVETVADPAVLRVVPGDGAWAGVLWTGLDAGNADEAIAAQVRRFAGLGRPWEWKLYSYDRPPDLADRLGAAGFRAGPVEEVLVAPLARLDLDVRPPAGVRLEPVADRAGAEALVAVHDLVFGGDHSRIGRELLAALEVEPRPAQGVVAVAGGEPVAAGRVELPPSGDFASLWGGGTVPAWRRRGLFRALVAWRAALAAARGFRYLQVDASPESAPILRRSGFARVATTTPFVHPGGEASAGGRTGG